MLYQSETTSSPNNVTVTLEDLNNIVNISACNLSAILFYVSAKFDEIREVNVSSLKELIDVMQRVFAGQVSTRST